MKTLNITLVEDEPGDASLIQYSLRFSGYDHNLEWVQSLAELSAHQRQTNAAADIVLLDLNLPDSTGIDTVTRCKSLVPDTPIVVLTGHDDMDFSLKVLEAGAQDYLVKSGLEGDALIRAMRYAIERHQMECRLQRSEELMTAAIEGGNLGVWDWNLKSGECDKSDLLLATLGFTRGDSELEPDSEPLIKRIHEDDAPGFHGALQAYLAGESPRFQCEFRLQHKDGHWPWHFISGHVVSWDGDEPERLVGIQQDITARKAMETRLRDLAMHDELTGLLNRRSFIQEMDREYGRVMRRPDYPVGLLMLDIDHFKRVNDSYGHAVGDVVLKAFADCIDRQLRENDVFGRLGGEEFAVLLPETDRDGVARVAEKLRSAVEGLETRTGNAGIHITTSIGAAGLHRDDERPDEALVLADQALYQAKHMGRNRVVIYSDTQVPGQPDPSFPESENAL